MSISIGSSDPDEIEELGLDEAQADSLLIVEWPERAPGRWPEALALTLDFAPDGGRALTASVPAAWEGAMAPDMNPPAGAAAFLDGLGWGDADVLPLAGDASFRRYFRVAGPWPQRDPDGCAAAARGPASRSSTSREWLTRARLSGAGDLRHRPDAGPRPARGFRRRADARDGRCRARIAAAAVRGGGRYPDPAARRAGRAVEAVRPQGAAPRGRSAGRMVLPGGRARCRASTSITPRGTRCSRRRWRPSR